MTPGPPYATTVPEHASVRAGETVQLQCLAHGTPPLTFQWSRVGGSLSRRVTARNEMLRFESVAPEDSGRYRCQVTNKVGSAEAFALVFVQGEQPSSGWAEGVQLSSRPFPYLPAGTWASPLRAQRPASIPLLGNPSLPPVLQGLQQACLLREPPHQVLGTLSSQGCIPPLALTSHSQGLFA